MRQTVWKLASDRFSCQLLRRLSVALIVCCATATLLPRTSEIMAAVTSLLGDQTVEATVDSNTQGTAEAFQTTATGTGTVTSLTFYVDASNKATQFTLGLYTNSSSRPRTLLGQASTKTFTAGAWNTIAMPSASVTKSTIYWIAILGSGGTAAFRAGGTNCSSVSSSQTTLTTLPSSWSSGKTYASCRLSAYGTASPTLSLSKTSVSFSATQGSGTNPAAASVSLTNTGSGAVSFTTSSDSTWLSVTPSTGAAPATLQLAATLGTMTAGTYTGHVTVTAAGALGSPAKITATFTVAAPPPYLSLSQGTVSFSAVQGSGISPAVASASLTNTGGGTMSFTAASDSSWLSVTPKSGSAPNTLKISATLGSLAANTYTGHITVTASGAQNSPTKITVTFVVSPPGPTLSLSKTSISFSGVQNSGTNPAAASISLTNAGSGAVSFTTSSDSTWLSVTPSTGAAPATLQLAATLGTMTAGTYTGHVTVTAAGALGSPAKITATFTVAAPPPYLSLSQGTVSFSAVQGSGISPAVASASLTNTGGGTMSFTAASDSSWLSVTPTSGSAPNTLKISATLGSLAANTYTGHITVTASGAQNSPTKITVTFVVSPPAPILSLSKTSISFNGVQNSGTNPASASVNVTNTGGGTLSFSTSSDSAWLSVSSNSSMAPATLQLSADITGLSSMTYTGYVTVTPTGSQPPPPQTITVNLVVAPPPPVLSLSPLPQGGLTFSAVAASGIDPAPVAVILSNTGSGSFTFSASSNANWLTVSPSGDTVDGNTPATLQISASAAGLSANAYPAIITITAPGAVNSPATIPVSFSLASPIPSALLGDAAIASQVMPVPAGQATAFPVIASADGSLGSLTVYLDAQSTASQLLVGLYADVGDGTAPASLLSQGTSSGPLTSGGWNQIMIPAVDVTAQTTYWIAAIGLDPLGGSPVYRADTLGACASATGGDGPLTALDSVWSAGATSSSCPVSAFGSVGSTPTVFGLAGVLSPPSTGGSLATVALTGLPLAPAPASTVSGGDGSYLFGGLVNGTYTVTPSNTGFVFTPGSQIVTINGASVPNVNFGVSVPPPPTFMISGTISGQGGVNAPVALNSGSDPATATADASGNYSFSGLLGGNYIVTPGLAGYLYTPPSQTVTIASLDQTSVNFTSAPAPPTYSISGTITPASNGSGVGALLTLTGAANATITADPSTGKYTLTGLLAGAYVVTPSGPGAGFSPAGTNVTLSAANKTGVNFTATAVTFHPATITWTNVHQTIDGFGASTAYDDPLTPAEADMIFSTTNGIGMSLLRTAVPDDGSCTTVNATCAGDVANMQLAVARGAQIWSTPWSPPASMKTNGSTVCNTGSGNSGLTSGSYAAYATYLSNYISSLSTLYSIPLYALSVQNEPDYCPSGYDGAIWSGANFDTFIKNNLGPTLAANGQTGVRVVMPESSLWSSFASEAGTCMADSACYQYVGINAWHDYDNASSITNPYSSLGKGFWETEASAGSNYGPSLCGGCWDPSMADGLLWAGIIDKRIAVSNANSWNFWWLTSAPPFDNEALLGTNDVAAKRFYVMGNYSKFVRPGWVRIDATHAPVSGITVSAYKDPVSGNFAVVVTNQNTSTAGVTFSLSGFTATTVTPWLTSTTLNLVQQPSFQGTGGTFNATLPPSSVTTFIGTAGN